MENASKPVIAAIHGTALGGGFEVALTAHYRIAVPSAKCGLPEIKLGIIPGAGGTQRLPRLIGAEKALDVILSGTPFSAREAKEWGVVDELAEEGKLRESALALRPTPDRREGALEEGARPIGQDRAGARPSRNLRGDPQGQCAKIPRLRGLEEGDRVGEERGRSAVRRGHGQGARDFQRAGRHKPVQGAALRLFRRAAGGEGRRHSRRHADPEDRQGRRDRRRHHGRRHFDEFPQRRHSRDDRRNLEGSARPRRLDHAPELREHRQEGPHDTGRGRGADGQAEPDA